MSGKEKKIKLVNKAESDLDFIHCMVLTADFISHCKSHKTPGKNQTCYE
jgi:hypothetical protein